MYKASIFERAKKLSKQRLKRFAVGFVIIFIFLTIFAGYKFEQKRQEEARRLREERVQAEIQQKRLSALEAFFDDRRDDAINEIKAIPAYRYNEQHIYIDMLAILAANSEDISLTRSLMKQSEEVKDDFNYFRDDFMKLVNERASAGNINAQLLLGKIYMIEREQNAMSYFVPLAENGNIYAQIQLAEIYNSHKDYDNALKFYSQLAEKKDEYSQRQAAEIYNSRKDYDNALKWYLTLAEKGDTYSQRKAADIYYFSRKDYDNALKWYLTLAENEDKDGTPQFMAAEIYNSRKDYDNALKWYLTLAEKGDTYSQRKAADIYYFSRKDYDNALKWYLTLAENEDKDGTPQFMAAEIYNLRKDYDNAAKFYLPLAEKGETKAQDRLANLYEGLKDYDSALSWHKKLADSGNAASQYKIGQFYEKGLGVEKNYNEAAKWYDMAAKQDYTEAQSSLGVMYLLGRGVRKDEEMAFDLLQEAAEKNDAQAQGYFGFIFWSYAENNKRSPQDDNLIKAYELFNKSTEQGHPMGQFGLGLMYYKSQAVSKNNKTAFEWFIKSAEQNFGPAQYMLGVMYENGEGVEKNLKLAPEYYRKAALDDITVAFLDFQKESQGGIKRIERILNPTEKNSSSQASASQVPVFSKLQEKTRPVSNILPVVAEVSIPKNARIFNKHSYMVYNEALTWEEAERKCRQLGGHLCTITSREEYNFIINMLPSTKKLYWLGANDLEIEGTWKWVTGEPFTFMQWLNGEPNGGRNENYLLLTNIYHQKWGWNDGTSGAVSPSMYAYICEWDEVNKEISESLNFIPARPKSIYHTKIFLRSIPDTTDKDSEIISKLDEGISVEALQENTYSDGQKWFLVKIPDGKEGWIFGDYIRDRINSRGEHGGIYRAINGNDINLRTSPNTSPESKFGKLDDGNLVEVIRTIGSGDNKWSFVYTIDGKPGWVFNKYIRDMQNSF